MIPSDAAIRWTMKGSSPNLAASSQVAEVDRKTDKPKGARARLMHFVEHCHGDDQLQCPIPDELAGAAEASPAQPRRRAGIGAEESAETRNEDIALEARADELCCAA